jgi:hypothetical protein
VATHSLSSWWRWHSASVALALVPAALSSCMGRGAVESVASFSSWDFFYKHAEQLGLFLISQTKPQ